ncbi:hypothetical protein [Candidatus Poriferisodalis sp.]|uniref:hypothetical protein n=1 Tax=Candidatus Poriferisodalis sp. TaxID=3101277 RepID=UPI003B020360
MPNPTGVQTGREAYGTFIDVNINGRVVTFPGEVKGLSLSSPAAGAGQDQRQRAPSGNIRTIDPDVSQQPRTLTLQVDMAAHLRDYRAIAALEGTSTRLPVRQRRLELPVSSALTGTVEISQAFVPTFAGDPHVADVTKGMALQPASGPAAGKDFVIRELEGKAGSVDLTAQIDELTVLLDQQGITAGAMSEFTEGTELVAAVAAVVYKTVWPATDTGFFNLLVISAPRIGDFSGGERGQVATAAIVFELVDDNVPYERPTNLPTVAAA